MAHTPSEIPLDDLEQIEQEINSNRMNIRSNRLTCLDKYDKGTLVMLFLALNVVIVFLVAMIMVIAENLEQRKCIDITNNLHNKFASLYDEYIRFVKEINLNNNNQ
jgi:hypothetical protein